MTRADQTRKSLQKIYIKTREYRAKRRKKVYNEEKRCIVNHVRAKRIRADKGMIGGSIEDGEYSSTYTKLTAEELADYIENGSADAE